MSGADGDAAGLGSAAEEAAKLLAAAERWVRAHAVAAGGTFGEEHFATGSPECTVCPICQAVGALRHVRPETVAHLLDAGTSLVAALRSAVAPTASDPQPGGHVQRIDLDHEVGQDRPGGPTDPSEAE